MTNSAPGGAGTTGWHRTPRTGSVRTTGPCGTAIASSPGLAHAIELTKPYIHDIGRELGPEWGERWGSWIIFLRQGSDYLAGPGPVNPQDPSQIMAYDALSGLDQPLPYLSLSEMLATWLGIIDSGRVTYDPCADRDPWQIDYVGLRSSVCDRL